MYPHDKMSRSFPIQKLPISKKTQEWREACVDGIIGRENLVLRNGRTRKQTMKINYDLYNSIFDEDDLKHITDPYKTGDNSPASLQNFNIIKPKIDLLIGEETKRPFNFRVFQANDDSVSKIQQISKELLFEYVQAEIESKLTGNKQNGEQKTPEQIQKYLTKSYTDISEKTAYHTLNYLKNNLNLVHEFVKGWKDSLITGEEIYYVGIVNGEPVAERINPYYFSYDTDPNLEFIEDGDWALHRMKMTPASIYDRFYDKMSEEDLDKIIDLFNGQMGANKASEVNYHSIMYKDVIATDILNEQYFTQYINVWHSIWKSFKKIGFLTYIDENGESQQMKVNEDYKKNEGEEIEWDWIVEIWEGYRIGEDIYIGIQPVQYQYVSMDNPNAQRLPYHGARYNNTNSFTRSLVDIMKPLQYIYIEIWYRLTLTIARDKGKVILMDITQIPKNSGITPEKWMHYLSSMGVAFINPYEEGWDIPGREGGKPASFNQFTSLDLTMGNVIAQYIQLMEKIEVMIGELSGVSRQRQGAISTNELVGNVERAVIQSSNITEPLFWLHNQVKRRVITSLLDTAKYAWSESNKKKLHYIQDDMTRIFMNITDDFLYSDHAVFIGDSTKENFNLDQMKSFLQPAIQNGATLYEASTILTSDNVTEIRNKLKDIDIKKQQVEQQRFEQEQQTQLQIQQMQSQDKQVDLQFKQEDSIRKSETAIQVALINAESNDGGEEVVEEDNSGEMEKIQIQRKKIEDDARLKEKQISETIRHNKATESINKIKKVTQNGK